MKAFAFLIAVMFAVSATSSAQTPLTFAGAASQSCSQWSAARRDSTRTTNDTFVELAITSWAQGFLIGTFSMATLLELAPTDDDSQSPAESLAEQEAAFGTVSGWVYDPPDTPTLQVWLDIHCRQYPSEPIAVAAAVLAAEIVMKDAREP